MSNYSSLKATINANIKTNGNQEITGSVLNSVLNAMVTTLGAGYQYAGVATPSTNPGTPDNKIFYLATTAGTYTNFGSLVLAEDEVAILKWDTAWSKQETGIATTGAVVKVDEKVNVPVTETLDFSLNGYIKADGAYTNSSNFRATDFIPVSPGDVVVFSLAQGTTLPSVAAYNSSKTFIQALSMGTGSFQTNARVTIPSSPSGIAFVRVSGRATTHDTHPQANPSGTLVTFDKAVHESLLNSRIAAVSDEVESVGIFSSNGYINVQTMAFTNTNAFRTTNLIPIYPGFVIRTNSSLSYPFSQAGHAFYGADATSPKSTPLAAAPVVNGEITITQEQYDLGYRYLVLSFLLSATPTPEASVYKTIKQMVKKTDADLSAFADVFNTNQESDVILIRRTSDSVFNVYVPSRGGKVLRYYFEKYYKKWDSLEYLDGNGQTQTKSNVVSADVWNNFYVYNNADNSYICQGHSNFIFKVVGESNHAGDGHGCEVMKYCTFLADGVEVNPATLTTDLKCKVFECIWKSEVYKSDGSGNSFQTTYPALDTSGNPIVTAMHYLKMRFNIGNKVTIDNRLEIKRDNIQFVQCHAAMLEVNYGDFSFVSVDNADSSINQVSDGGGFTPIGNSQVNLYSANNILARKGMMYGKGFSVFQEILPDDPARVAKCNINVTKYEDRLKLYFMPVGTTTTGSQVDAETFNSGDCIHVMCNRVIE